MVKKAFLLLSLIFCLATLNAQEKNRIKVRIEPGVPIDTNSENLGFFLNFEPKIALLNKMVIGLRFGVALNAQEFENNNTTQFNVSVENDNAIISFVPTLDYYWNENYTRPFIGLGLGYFSISQVALANPTDTVKEGSVRNQLGLLLRGGVELGNTRLALEYNVVPKAEIELPNNQIMGKVDSSYLGLAIGFTLGGRKDLN